MLFICFRSSFLGFSLNQFLDDCSISSNTFAQALAHALSLILRIEFTNGDGCVQARTDGIKASLVGFMLYRDAILLVDGLILNAIFPIRDIILCYLNLKVHSDFFGTRLDALFPMRIRLIKPGKRSVLNA